MKKVIILIILILSISLIGCNSNLISNAVDNMSPTPEGLQRQIDEQQLQITSLKQQIEDLENNQTQEIVLTPELQDKLVQMLYDLIDEEFSEEDLYVIIDRMLNDNDFYEAYQDEVYSQIQQFWDDWLQAVIAEIEAEQNS